MKLEDEDDLEKSSWRNKGSVGGKIKGRNGDMVAKVDSGDFIIVVSRS